MNHKYHNESQQRILRAVMILAGNEFHGLLSGELAKALKISPVMATRDLHNLYESGFAEKIQETGRWRLGPKLVQVSLSFTTGVQRSESRLNEIKNRYTREA